jgi:signal peptidase I
MSGNHAAIDGRAGIAPSVRRRARTSGRRTTGVPVDGVAVDGVHAGQRAPVPRMRLVVGLVVAVGIAVFLAALVGAASVGARWFDVRTPSMGTAAPVGSLVVTRPVSVGHLHVGDVISFHPPTEPGATYTHRVVALPSDGSVVTRGDVNGARDPWTIRQADLVGRAALVVPGVGWALRALPFLAVGFLAVWVGTSLIRRADHRSAARVLGVSLVVAVTGAVLRPFVAATLVETTTNTDHAVAVVVSTGLLPTRVSVVGGASTRLLSGEVGRLPLGGGSDHVHRLATAVDLSPAGWVAYLAIAALPMLWCMVVGFPRARDLDGAR